MSDSPLSGAENGGARFFIVGLVRRPHGVRGELAVSLETDRPKAVFRPGRVLQVGDAEGRPLGRALTVERARPFKDGMLVKPVEHSTLDAGVEQLRGRSLLIPASEAAAPEAGEVFYHDLVGMEVLAAGTRLGRVRDVLPTPGADLLVIRPARGKELLVPFVKEMVRGIDLEKKEIEIDPPEGLLEL